MSLTSELELILGKNDDQFLNQYSPHKLPQSYQAVNGISKKRLVLDDDCESSKKQKIEFAHPLFKYTSELRKQAIREASVEHQMDEVVYLIKTGSWNTLLTEGFQGRSLRKTAFVALAAFEKKKISLEEVSTAIRFLNAVSHSKGKFIVIPNRNQTTSDSPIPTHLNYELCYTIHEVAVGSFKKEIQFLEESKELLPDELKSDLESLPFCIPSFPIQQARLDQCKIKVGSFFSQQLHPVLGTSERWDMIEHLEENPPKADTALAMPGELIGVHGFKNVGALLDIHDYLHALSRINTCTKISIKLAKALEHMLVILPDYKEPLIAENVVFSIPKHDATEEDLIRFAFDTFSGLLVDALKSSKIDVSNPTLHDLLKESGKEKDDLIFAFNRSITHHIESFRNDIDKSQSVELKVTAVEKLENEKFLDEICEKAVNRFAELLPKINI